MGIDEVIKLVAKARCQKCGTRIVKENGIDARDYVRRYMQHHDSIEDIIPKLCSACQTRMKIR
jgi:hypothetical protein